MNRYDRLSFGFGLCVLASMIGFAPAGAAVTVERVDTTIPGALQPQRPQEATGHEEHAVQEADVAQEGHADHGEVVTRSGPVAAPELPAVSDMVRFVDHPEESVLELVFGPVSLPEGGPHLRTRVQLVELPIAGWLHGFTWDMRDGQGNVLPSDLLHHVNFIDPDSRELFSPIARRVIAAGRETQEQRMPKLLGYPFAEGTRFLISAMFANPTPEDHLETYLHVRLEYSDGGLIDPRNVYPFYLDVLGPVGAKEFPLPPGEKTVTWEGSPVVDGRILGIGGHLHDYGKAIALEDVTEGDVVWETEPELDENGRVVAVPSGKLWWKGGIKIYRDHVYRITVTYDNPLDEPAPDGGMGVIGGVVWADPADWPALEKTDVAYAQDLVNTLEAPMKARSHDSMSMGGDPDGEKPRQSQEPSNH